MDPALDDPLVRELETAANAATMAGHIEWANLMRRAGAAIRRLHAAMGPRDLPLDD
jgi:hypothetical protein